MGCCSRSTYCIVLGSICIVLYVIFLILSIYSLVVLATFKFPEDISSVRRDSIEYQKLILIILIVLCSIMIALSSLLVAGVVKRRHSWMMPWLVLSALGYIYNCGHFIFSIIQSIILRADLGTVFITFLVGVLILGLSAFLLWPFFKLYGEIRKDNTQKNGRIVSSPGIEYKTNSDI